MYEKLARKAIDAAIAYEWNTALDINLQILSKLPEDINTLNRTSRALVEVGDIDKALEYAQKVISIDPLNTIALKCISKCETLKAVPFESQGKKIINTYSDSLFLEEPGKTKIVSLINLCDEIVLAQLNTGEQVNMQIGSHKVSVITISERYIGKLPDDVSTRIIFLTKNGNSYLSYIKSVNESGVKVFIKENMKSNVMNNTVSFPNR